MRIYLLQLVVQATKSTFITWSITRLVFGVLYIGDRNTVINLEHTDKLECLPYTSIQLQYLFD